MKQNLFSMGEYDDKITEIFKEFSEAKENQIVTLTLKENTYLLMKR